MKLLNSNRPIKSDCTILRPNGKVVGRCADIYWDPYPSDVIVLSFVDLTHHTVIGAAVTLDNFDVVAHKNGKCLIFHNCRIYKCIRIQQNGKDLFIGSVIANFKQMEEYVEKKVAK